MERRIDLYVGCALTHATEAYRNEIMRLKQILRGEHFDVIEFLGLTEGTNIDVYDTDIERGVGGCQLFVGFGDGPSTGLGIEVGAALWYHKKPMMLLAQQDAKVSRLVLGLAERHPAQVSFLRYGDMCADVPSLIAEHCKKLCLDFKAKAPLPEQYPDPVTGEPVIRKWRSTVG